MRTLTLHLRHLTCLLPLPIACPSKMLIFSRFVETNVARVRRPATACVMKSPSVPNPQEAKDYHYTFEPVPMDEPPMDTRTFNHYFHKPRHAEWEQIWVTRFPRLHSASLYHSNKFLPKGRGT